MNIQKIVGTLLLVIGVALITLGTYQVFFKDDTSSKPQEEEKKSPEKSQEEYDKILKIERNTSKNLAKKKCLDKLCFENLTIFIQDEVYYVTADIKNTGNTSIENKYITLVFKGDGISEQRKVHQIINIGAGETPPYELQFLENGQEMIEKVNDYKLEEATTDDIATINQ